MNNVSLGVKHGSFRCVSHLYMSQSTQVKFPRGLPLGSPLTFLTSSGRSGSLVLCGMFTWPLSYLDYRTFPIPILIALFHLPFHCKFFLCQEVFLNFVRVSELPKYLVHLPDGIYRVTSPILKNKHMSYAVAKKNEKCQNVHTLVPPFGSLSSTTLKAGFH